MVQTPLRLTGFLAIAVGTAGKPSEISPSVTPCNLPIILLGKGPEVLVSLAKSLSFSGIQQPDPVKCGEQIPSTAPMKLL